MQLIIGLTKQIDGQLTLKNHNPPIFTIKFKNNGNDQSEYINC
jgi:hypothetical protein